MRKQNPLERQVLPTLRGGDEALSVSEIAGELGLPSRSVRRVLGRLAIRRLVEDTGEWPPRWRITARGERVVQAWDRAGS